MFTKPELYVRIDKQKVILKVLTIIINLFIFVFGSSKLSSAAVVVLRIWIFCKELTSKLIFK